MKHRASTACQAERPRETTDARAFVAPLLGLALALALFAAPLAGAEEPETTPATEESAKPPDATDAGDQPASDGAPAPAATAAPAAGATPKVAAPDSGIEEIVVRGAESETATDFEAADSVTGFSAEDLAALGASDISDLAAFTPNLEIVTAGATTPTFFIRGVGLNDFNSNSTGAVAIYQDDVPINAPALQLATLYDTEAVNVLRGPQGTGLARNASAGAIKLYSRKPTGEFNGFLRSEIGNYNARDFEGAFEAPIYEDLVAGRFAFRLTERDGTMKNRCGNATPFSQRTPSPSPGQLRQLGQLNTDAPWSICGEPVEPNAATGDRSTIAEGLPSFVNDLNNWAARGTLLFQPTLDMNWLVNAHGSRRDEWSRLGQSIGTGGGAFFCADGDVTNCGLGVPGTSRVLGLLGGTQGIAGTGYSPPEVRNRQIELAPCMAGAPLLPGGVGSANCLSPLNQVIANNAKIKAANELAQHLDNRPWAGDFSMCSDKQVAGEYLYRDPTGTRCKNSAGKTTNDTYGGYLNGSMGLPGGMKLTSVSGYDHYDRWISIDLDFSPETLFQIQTDDDGWQFAQGLQLEGTLGYESPVRWDIGGWFLKEQLNVVVTNDLGKFSAFGVGVRDYTQDMMSSAGYASLAWDFWDDFTLDGGVRFNWEQKKLDYSLVTDVTTQSTNLKDDWTAPTGTVRLTYRFREDTHAYWKYTRGWKPGTYNATSSPDTGVTTADPETIDAFETGLRGSWFDGRFSLDSSLFYYDYNDYQIFTAQQFAGGQPEFVIINANSAEVYGAEIDAVARPWTGAFANVRFGWLQSQFLDFVQVQQETIIVNGAQVTVDRQLNNTGNPLLNSPKFKVSLTGEQTIQLGHMGSLTGRYDGVWTDTTYYDATKGRGLPNLQDINALPKDTTAQPAYWIHNLRLAYRTPNGQVEIAGWVRNLTNQSYKSFAFDASTFNGTTIYFVGDPRTYGGTLTVTF